MTEEQSRELDRVTHFLSRTVMVSGVFKSCIEQNFEEEAYGGGKVAISSNKGLFAELHGRVVSRLDHTMKTIGAGA
jgi:hypothetical protein